MLNYLKMSPGLASELGNLVFTGDDDDQRPWIHYHVWDIKIRKRLPK